MTERAKRHPDVPNFDGARLDAIATAFGRRAKALKYHSQKFLCTREVTSVTERFNVDLETLEDRPTQIRLSVWDDGVMWLGAYRAKPRREGGWQIEFRGHGDLARIDPTKVVAAFEETYQQLRGSPADAVNRLRRIWSFAGLSDEA